MQYPLQEALEAVAHQLNNPLTTIYMNAAFLSKHSLVQKEKTLLTQIETIQSAVEQMRQTLQNFVQRY